MTVPLREFRQWMRGVDPSATAADVAVRDDPPEREENSRQPIKHVLVWRGTRNSEVAEDIGRIRPGDTVVIPTTTGGWNVLGHIPSAPADPSRFVEVDVAERATRDARLQVVLRIRPDPFPKHGSEDLRRYATSRHALRRNELRDLLRTSFSETELPSDVLDHKFEEHVYPGENGEKPGIVFRFRELLADPRKMPEPSAPDDEADDPLLDIAPDKPVPLDVHTGDVVKQLRASLQKLSLSPLNTSLIRAAELHDIGKCDPRFQAMLLGVTPEESMYRPVLLAKSSNGAITKQEREEQRKRSRLPDQFRHEMLSVEIVQNTPVSIDSVVDRALLLQLIAAHHGYARPFAPVVMDSEPLDLDLSAMLKVAAGADKRRGWVRAHRLDSGITDGFWSLTRRFGWWGLPYLEAALRLADQQASEIEQSQSPKG